MNTTANASFVSAAPDHPAAVLPAPGRHSPPFKTGNGVAVSEQQVQALAHHIAQKYGPQIGWEQLGRLLQDRGCVAYPCELRFDSDPLLPGEFGYVSPNGVQPEEGFVLYLHPHYSGAREIVPHLVLHQLARVNFGESASAEDAETFGSVALGLQKEAYFRLLCELADQLGGDDLC